MAAYCEVQRSETCRSEHSNPAGKVSWHTGDVVCTAETINQTWFKFWNYMNSAKGLVGLPVRVLVWDDWGCAIMIRVQLFF